MPMPPSTELRPWEPLYHLVAGGMWLYTRTAFRVETLGDFEPKEGLLVVATHRAESDVPLICPSVYARGRYFRSRDAPRLAFAAREDMFERGFFAGFPAGLPITARRLLYPLEAGPWLPRVRVHPIPYPSISHLRLGRALEALPARLSLREALPAGVVQQFERRSAELGLPAPRLVGDVRQGAYADLLWRFCTHEELTGPHFEQLWRERSATGAAQLRRLIGHLRSSGEMLLVFPEGRPSPDGAIGPLEPGIDLLVRRGRPAGIALLAVAYDHLVTGRPRALVACGPTLAGDVAPLEEAVLDGLRATMPLTGGQVVSREVLRAAEAGSRTVRARELEDALVREIESASEAGRLVEPALLGPHRRERLCDAVAAVVRRRLAVRSGGGSLELRPDRVLRDSLVLRLGREHASARGLEPPALRLPCKPAAPRSPSRGGASTA